MKAVREWIGRAQSERREYKEREQAFLATMEPFVAEANQCVTKYFPGTNPEAWAPRLKESLRRQEADERAHAPIGQRLIIPTRRLVAFAIIRHVDDVIDKALWPKFRKTVGQAAIEQVRTNFRKFLEEMYKIAHAREEALPPDIIELPLLELDMEFDQSQKNFDEKVIPLVERKSLDVKFLRELTGNFDPPGSDVPALRYRAMCLADILRDFSDRAREKDTDLNLFRIIRDNRPRIKTKVLQDYVEETRSLIGGRGKITVTFEGARADADDICARLLQGLKDAESAHS